MPLGLLPSHGKESAYPPLRLILINGIIIKICDEDIFGVGAQEALDVLVVAPEALHDDELGVILGEVA